MNYPKPVMKATELEKMGFPREFLLYAFRRKGQTYAWKMKIDGWNTDDYQTLNMRAFVAMETVNTVQISVDWMIHVRNGRKTKNE